MKLSLRSLKIDRQWLRALTFRFSLSSSKGVLMMKMRSYEVWEMGKAERHERYENPQSRLEFERRTLRARRFPCVHGDTKSMTTTTAIVFPSVFRPLRAKGR